MAQPDVVRIAAADLLPTRHGSTPLYSQLASGIERAIESNALPPGSRLENELALSERLGLSRPTVRRALQELVQKGLLVRRRGVGTQVVNGAVARRIELTSLFDDLEQSGRRPTTTVLHIGPTPADGVVAEQLGVAPGTTVLYLRRLRFADQVPISILENYLAPAYIDLDKEALTERGLYAILREQGATMRVAQQRIGARRLSAREGRLLALKGGSPALTMDRTTYDASGKAVEYGHHSYRPDLYAFEMTVIERP